MSAPRHRPSRPAAAATGAVLLATAALLAPPAAADRTVRLRHAFETQRGAATFRVPAEWAARTGSRAVTLTAPSSRAGCRHVIDARLNALYVAQTTTAAGWVASRLLGQGVLVAAGPPADLSWAVVARPRARASSGAAARVTGKGRYGPIMSELLFTTRLDGDCPANQGLKAARRVGRLMTGVAITATAITGARASRTAHATGTAHGPGRPAPAARSDAPR